MTTPDQNTTSKAFNPLAVTQGSELQSPVTAGGLSYQNATPEEKAEMDRIMQGIVLHNPETIVSLGAEQREKLATLSDKILNSLDPSAKMAFAEALKSLIDLVKDNGLSEIKKRIQDGALQKIGKRFLNAFAGKDNRQEEAKEMLAEFMTDITKTRKDIETISNHLLEQWETLQLNFQNINQLGLAINTEGQNMRIVRAATAEYIAQVDNGQNTILKDLKAKAEQTGRADDFQRFQDAQNGWNALRTMDGNLLGSIAVYDMNLVNLAFTRQANIQNRMDTANTLTNTVAEWKTQLAVFATMMTEKNAANLLGTTKDLSDKAVKANIDLFDELVEISIKNAARTGYNLSSLKTGQAAMIQKLETVGTRIEENFTQLAADKKALEESSQAFREATINPLGDNAQNKPKKLIL